MRDSTSLLHWDFACFDGTTSYALLVSFTDTLLEEAGKRIRAKICEENASVVFYYSPYLRAKQTLDEIMPLFDAAEVFSSAEEPRISEQQIGNFQNVQQVLGKCEYHHILSMNTYINVVHPLHLVIRNQMPSRRGLNSAVSIIDSQAEKLD